MRCATLFLQSMNGVVAFYTAKDVPGKNTFNDGANKQMLLDADELVRDETLKTLASMRNADSSRQQIQKKCIGLYGYSVWLKEVIFFFFFLVNVMYTISDVYSSLTEYHLIRQQG